MSNVLTADQIVKVFEDSFDDDSWKYAKNQAGSDSFGWLTQRMGYYTTIRHRSEGRYMPIYENEMDLKAIRAACYLLDAEHPVAISIRNRLIDYTISTGFDWTVEHDLVGLTKYLKAGVDETLENSSWCGELEQETFWRELIAGESIGFIDQSEGSLFLQTVEPECLTEPRNTMQLEDYYGIGFPASWSFGVVTEQNRSRPRYYHFVFNDSGSDWDLKPASDVWHWKRNAPLSAKRGAPDNFAPHKLLRAGEKVLDRTAAGAAIQASIAYIVEHAQSVAPETISKLAAARQNNVVRRFDSLGNGYNVNSVRAGQVIDIRNGAKFHAGLLGSVQSQIYIEVMDACMRMSGLQYAMPEHMVTGYAGNNNKASSDTAESPFIQGRYANQNVRAERLESLIKKICKKLVDLSGSRWNWADVKAGLRINVSAPDIVTRDIKATTDALISQKKEGWVSDRQAMTILQYDYDDMKEQIDSEIKDRPQDWMSITNPAGVGFGQPKVVGRQGPANGQPPSDQTKNDQSEQQAGAQ